MPVATGPASSARGPTYVPREASRSVAATPTLAISAASYFRDGAVMQASLLGDLAERKAGSLSVGECLAPRLSHVLSVLLKLGLGVADGLAGLLLGVGGHPGWSVDQFPDRIASPGGLFYLPRMVAEGIKTGAPLDFEGFWWEPADGGEEAVAQGRLQYDPSSGAVLSVVDLHPGPEGIMSGPSSQAVLHGATLNGRPCTLFDPMLQERTGGLFSGHSQERWLSNLLFYGTHISNLADFSFRRARIGLRGLAEWLNEPWPAAEPHSFKGIAKEGIVEVRLSGARLLFQEGETTKTEAFSKHTEVDFTALFEFDDPITFPELHDRFIRPLHDLLILATNEEIHIEEITLLIPEDLEKWWDDKEPIKHVNEVAVLQRSGFEWQAARHNAFHQVPLPFAALGEDPVAAVRRWYDLRQELAGAGNSLFGTINRRHRTLEPDLLT